MNSTKCSIVQRAVFCIHLQADSQVDSAAKGCADGSWVKAEVFEEFGEGVCERHPGPLLCHHHTSPNPGQIQTSSLERENNYFREGLKKKGLRNT